MNFHITDKNYYLIGVILYILFSLSLFFGFFLNEDASGTGTYNDFKKTWEYVVLLKDNYLIDIEWTVVYIIFFYRFFIKYLKTSF